MISELIPEGKRRLYDLERQLIELEKGNTAIQPNDITVGLKEVAFKFEEIEKLIQKEQRQKRDDFRRRLQHLRNTHQHIQDLLHNFYQRNPYLYEKSQLFGGKVGSIHQRANLEDDMALELAENGSLSRSSKMINDYLAVGRDTLGELVNQRERLKGIQRRAFDILNYLGLSNTVMKNVEMRDWVDKWIVYGGMIFIFLLMIFVWWYFRK